MTNSNNEQTISKQEREYLRELARKQREYANLPVMAEREQLWFRHNALKAERPVVAFDTGSFMPDLLPELKCTSKPARFIEHEILKHTVDYEIINDDKVVPANFTVNRNINIRLFNLDYSVIHGAPDSTGRQLAYHDVKTIEDLERDYHKLSSSVVTYDAESTQKIAGITAETIGDILPVVMKNNSLVWFPSQSTKIVKLMGLEDMMLNLYDYPEKMHELYDFITNDIIEVIKWQEGQGLLTLNNGNDYAGAGSRGYTNELPKSTDGIVRPRDLWGNLNSQETVSVSPAMYHEFCFPYYKRIAEIFGLVYYGCCEPVHSIWEDSVSKYPGLRKVSISPWCDEEYMGEALRGSGVIYSRKPSPNFVGVSTVFDEDAFAAHIEKTLKAARGCGLEIIYRDIVTLRGDRNRLTKAMAIIRKLIDKIWQQETAPAGR